MVWPITRRPQILGSIHLTEAAFARQRMAGDSGSVSNRGTHALNGQEWKRRDQLSVGRQTGVTRHFLFARHLEQSPTPLRSERSRRTDPAAIAGLVRSRSKRAIRLLPWLSRRR